MSNLSNVKQLFVLHNLNSKQHVAITWSCFVFPFVVSVSV